MSSVQPTTGEAPAVRREAEEDCGKVVAASAARLRSPDLNCAAERLSHICACLVLARPLALHEPADKCAPVPEKGRHRHTTVWPPAV
jgi:hypothetical protein